MNACQRSVFLFISFVGWSFLQPINAQESNAGVDSTSEVNDEYHVVPTAASGQKDTLTQQQSGKVHITDKSKEPGAPLFNTGIEYFRSGNYPEALKSFQKAYAKESNPLYQFWVGKTFRQLNRNDTMVVIMETIVSRYPESDVTDDALYELAFCYQQSENYHMAMEKYTQLAEQFPFGTSYTTGEEYLEISRRERQKMRSEILFALNILGFNAQTLAESYREFQKTNNLPVTASGDPETVRSIKAQYKAKVESGKVPLPGNTETNPPLMWIYVAGTVVLCNLGALIIIRLRIRQNKMHLRHLRAQIYSL
ncbi:MAG: tetratricopeptide repeat protein [Chitinivibrionales bacterium]|nr:tetratricopeptide repeat protein [Chitinivibrionales bacterium]